MHEQGSVMPQMVPTTTGPPDHLATATFVAVYGPPDQVASYGR